MSKINLLYFGSPSFSATILESLINSGLFTVVGVVTQKDKPQGRKKLLTPSSVAIMAEKYNLPIFKPDTLDAANLSHLRLLKPDISLVISYGKIIPQSWLDLPTIKTLNLHFSLLPKYRGALCISEAIRNQDAETGVTLMEMDAKLDHGPIIAAVKQIIDNTDDVASLTQKLTTKAITLLKYELPIYLDNAVAAAPQDESLASYTPTTKSHTHQTAFIDWEIIRTAMSGQNAAAVHALIRSLNPEPGAWTTVNHLDIKLLHTTLNSNALVIDTIQPAGKSVLTWKQFAQGHRI